jgi:DNA-binding response OmpR family regulator
MARILVIDGDEGARAACCEDLRRDGHRVIPVSCASAARDAVQREMPDLVVLDVGPPSGDGLGMVGELLALGRGIRIVLHTAHMLYQDDFRSWLADAYVRKRDDTSELRKAVREVLDRTARDRAVPSERGVTTAA